jgi:hypothetical protein
MICYAESRHEERIKSPPSRTRREDQEMLLHEGVYSVDVGAAETVLW